MKPIDVMMGEASRCRLAREVFDKVYDARESFRVNDLGADVAYLLGAILDPEDQGRSWVDWTLGATRPDTVALFKEVFPPNHGVWKFIEL